MAANKKVNVKVTARGTTKASSSLKKVDRSISGISKSAISATKAIGILAGLMALGRLAKATIDASARFETLRARLVGLKGSVEAANRTFETFKRIAETTPIDLVGVV